MDSFCSKVSIIVPVYKVENYLKECVESLRKQTYTNLEIILVDDGSPDRCGVMCDNYAALDDRIIVIHQKNQGLSGARNTGLAAATGEYVAFIDSDDVVDICYVEYLMEGIHRTGATLSICGVSDFRDGHSPLYERNRSFEIFSRQEALTKFFYQNKIRTGVVGKLFHHALLWSAMFEPGILYEDAEPMYRILYSADKIVWCDATLFGYRHRNTAQSKQKFSLREMDCITVWRKIENDVSIRCPELTVPVACRAFSAYSHIFFMIPKGTYETENMQIWELIKTRRKAVLSDPNARKRAQAAALLSFCGKNVMKSVGNYLLARENRKIFKEQR